LDSFATTVALIGIVILVASLISGVLERSGLPLVGVFLALGAVLGPYGLRVVNIGFGSPALHALAMLGLALVLFSDAVTIDRKDVSERRPLLIRILGPGTMIPAILIALSARFLLDVSWPASAILGAALASTDPVLLRSVLRSRALPETPRTALRMESGMNDVFLLPIVALAILALPATTRNHDVTGEELARHVVGLFILGPLLGALVGWLGIILLAQIRDRFGVRRDYESLYAIGLAFTGFALAEAVGGSGFLAAFAAGLMVSWQDVELCDCFLEYGEATAEMLLLLTFVALGTSLIWTGFSILDWRTILFTVVALTARTVVLYPVLARSNVSGNDRKIIALFGPRGLSSLLLVLLPVFAGVEGAEHLFTITCLVVMSSVVLHGGGIAWYLRRHTKLERLAAELAGPPAPAKPKATALPLAPETPGTARVDDKITIAELRDMQSRGDEVVIIDVRKDRNLRNSHTQAATAIRLHPEDPVRDAVALRLSQRATLVVYCA
jgi:NhaP-type Na+/H+ or K+/H+ antiporter